VKTGNSLPAIENIIFNMKKMILNNSKNGFQISSSAVFLTKVFMEFFLLWP